MTIHSTTICAVRKGGTVAIAGDGQASAQEAGIVMKGNCRKVRRLYDGTIIVGFAGSTADAITLSELLEGKLKQYNGDITRASVELAKDWRTDKMMKNLNAMMIEHMRFPQPVHISMQELTGARRRSRGRA